MRSDNVTKGAERAPNRSLFYALGYTPEELERPLIGVVSAYSEIVPGHMNLDKIADAVKAADKANSYSENATAYLIAGQSSQKLSKNADAIKYFEKYLEMKPDAKNAPAITFTVAALYQGAKNNAKALEFYKKVQDDPKFGDQAKQMITSLSK